MFQKMLFLLTITMCVAVFACKKDPPFTIYDCAGITPKYTNEVEFILNATCAGGGCHDAATKAGNINLSTYAAAKAEGAKDSFRGSIQHIAGYEKMPQGSSKMPDATIKVLSCWVQNGMPE